MTALTVSFTAGLAFQFRELLPTLGDHIDDNCQEVLPHLLMADYCRIIVEGGKEKAWVDVFLKVLEENYLETDDEISNLIFVSFIESLPDPGDKDEWIVTRLGHRMRHAYLKLLGLKSADFSA